MPLRPMSSLLLAMQLAACAPAAGDAPAGVVHASPVAPAISPALPPGAVARPSPGQHHGNWRLVAADDPHDAALMAFSLQSDRGDASGSGDYVLFQPFCDAVAGTPIIGDADCELIGLAADFERVDIDRDRIVLVFHPTADGMQHRLELHLQGDVLAGDYIAGANDIRRAVIARRPPAEAR